MDSTEGELPDNMMGTNEPILDGLATLPSSRTGEEFNELQTPQGETRQHWHDFTQHLNNLGQAELTERWNLMRRILRNHGVTYNVTAQAGSSERPWELDLTPFLIAPEDWQTIEQGAIQRARLFNEILKDLYLGPQYLLRNGLIPPALIFANPSFHRCCRGIPIPGNTFLQLLAIDVARAPDGRWWVLDTRTQNPKGMGYAIENRTIVGRVFQDIFRQLQVEPVHHFFSALRQNLLNLAPTSGSWPRVVMLTSGVHDLAYYEHALLARYLGYTLAEGSDLTVRDNRVHLKTVEGPQPVDVILRQVNDADCDPLELRESSFLGVPGLVQAARSGHVLIANALGSAIMETPALQTYLPELARYLLGQDLILPAAPARWCGEPENCHHTLENLPQLIIKNAFPSSQRLTQSGAELTPDEQIALSKAIQAHPQKYIGQRPIKLSHAPVWSPDGFTSRPVALRVYVTAHGDSFQVLPGGLTKVSSSAFSPVKGFQLDGGSKDTWVIGHADSPRTSTPINLESRPAARIQTGVPSRTADQFFWLGRYTERLENLAHILRSIVTRLVHEQEPRIEQQAIVLCDILNKFGFRNKSRGANRSLAQIEQAILQLTYQREHPQGVQALCQRISTIANSVRDRFSGDAWRVIHSFREFPGQPADRIPLGSLQSMLHRLLTTLSALAGLESDNMVRDQEWRFLQIGRRLERSQNLCQLLRLVLEHPKGIDLSLNPVLEISDSSMTYRRLYYSEPEAHSVLNVLLLSNDNPRALKFNLDTLQDLFRGLPRLSGEAQISEQELQLKRLKRSLTERSLDQMIVIQDQQPPIGRATRLKRWHAQLTAISDSLTHRYFSLLKTRPRLNELPSLSDPT